MDGTLAQILFNSVGTGISSVDISNLILLDSALSDIVATTLDGTVTIDSPEPATATFFGVGLLTFLLVSRRSRFGRNDAGAQICTAGHNRRPSQGGSKYLPMQLRDGHVWRKNPRPRQSRLSAIRAAEFHGVCLAQFNYLRH